MSPARCSSASCQRASGTRREIIRPARSWSALMQRVRRHLVVHAVGVDGAEHDVVVEHRDAIEAPDVERRLVVAADAGEADDAARRRAAEHAGDHRRRAGAFDDDIGRDAELDRSTRHDGWRRDRGSSRPWTGRGRDRAREPRSRAACPSSAASRPIGPEPVTSRCLRLPRIETASDPLDVIPRFRDDARGLHQHAQRRRAPDRSSPRTPARCESARRRSRDAP